MGKAFANTTRITEQKDVEVAYMFTFTLTASYSIPKRIGKQECIALMADVYRAPQVCIACEVYEIAENKGNADDRRLKSNVAYSMDVTVQSQERELMENVEARSEDTQVVVGMIADKLEVPLKTVVQTQKPQSAVEVELTLVANSNTQQVELEPQALAQGMSSELGMKTNVREALTPEFPTPAPVITPVSPAPTRAPPNPIRSTSAPTESPTLAPSDAPLTPAPP